VLAHHEQFSQPNQPNLTMRGVFSNVTGTKDEKIHVFPYYTVPSGNVTRECDQLLPDNCAKSWTSAPSTCLKLAEKGGETSFDVFSVRIKAVYLNLA
jgi:hypothetical protein